MNLINYFTPRDMTETINTQYPVAGAIRKMFFSNEKTHKLKTFDIEIKQGNRQACKFTSRKHKHQQITLRGYTVKGYEPPYIKLEGDIVPDELIEDKGFGNAPGTIPSPVAVMAEKVAAYHTTFSDMIDRRIELMCIEALTKFQVTVEGAGYTSDDLVEFPNLATHDITLTGTDLWDDAGSDKLAFLEDTCDKLIRKDAGLYDERIIIMGDLAWREWFNDTTLQSILNNRRIEYSTIKPELRRPDGLKMMQAIQGLGIIYTYDEWVTDPDSGTDTEVWDSKTILMASQSAKTTLHYGAVIKLDLTSYDVKKYAGMKLSDDNERYTTYVESAPLPVPTEINGFVVAKVLA